MFVRVPDNNLITSGDHLVVQTLAMATRRKVPPAKNKRGAKFIK